MRANPGGQIAPSEVIGRDRLIQRLWEILERQSLVLSAQATDGQDLRDQENASRSSTGQISDLP